jgi:hypothetical protein
MSTEQTVKAIRNISNLLRKLADTQGEVESTKDVDLTKQAAEKCAASDSVSFVINKNEILAQ